jgi:hypothetical protein
VLARFFAANKGARLLLTPEGTRTVAPRVAVEDVESVVSVPDKKSQSVRRVTFVLAKIDGAWRIASIREYPEESELDDAAARLKELERFIGEWVDEGGDSLVTTTVKLSADKSHLIRDFSIAQQGKEAPEKTAAVKPDDQGLQFLLAYHCITTNQPAAAKESLTRLNKLLPTDPVVNQLARAAGVESDKNEPKTSWQAPAEVALDITGDWTATRSAGGKIGLSVNPDGGFAWSVEEKSDKKNSFDGTFSLDDNMLVLERKSGGALMGRVTALADNKFRFKVLGGGDADTGLTFVK